MKIIHHMHLSLCGLIVLKHRRLTWMKVSGNWTKPEIKSFHWMVPGAINWWILLLDYIYPSKYFFFPFLPFGSRQGKKERLAMKMNGAITKCLREFWKGKITTSAVCGLFVKVAELNSISENLGEKIKIYVRAKMCFEAFLLFTICFADP